MKMRQLFAGTNIDTNVQYREALKAKSKGDDCEFHTHSPSDAFCIPETEEPSPNHCWTTNLKNN